MGRASFFLVKAGAALVRRWVVGNERRLTGLNQVLNGNSMKSMVLNFIYSRIQVHPS